MARGLPGTDSSLKVTPDLIQSATNILGEKPKFWGRYFKSPTGGSSAEYRRALEDPVLAPAGIKVLPIAQQTSHVNGSEELGKADAKLNVADLLATFPLDHLIAQGGKFLMFLDVEGVPNVGAPSLSLSYYTGWAQTLVAFSQSQTNNAITLLPCVYARTKDNVTWDALIAANANGIKCHGAWVARFHLPPNCHTRDFEPDFALPNRVLPFDVLIWQYAEKCSNDKIDLDQTNPAIDDIETVLLNHLILPP